MILNIVASYRIVVKLTALWYFKMLIVFIWYLRKKFLILWNFSGTNVLWTERGFFNKTYSQRLVKPVSQLVSSVTQSSPTLRNPMDCSLPGSSVHGIFQARVLEWGDIAFSNSLAKVLQKYNKKLFTIYNWVTRKSEIIPGSKV